MGLLGWVQQWIVGGANVLPEAIVRLLAGQPIRRDEQELVPEVQLALHLMALGGHRSLDTLTPDEARAQITADARLFAGKTIPVAGVEQIAVDGASGPLSARLYVPRPERSPLVVYYHGGGWVVGDLDTHDSACRFLAAETGCRVLSVAYRLAPEHPFPAAADDAVAAFRWAAAHAERLGADPSRVAVAGDSAGGNLAAVVSQTTTRSGGPRPAAQLLIYPATDLVNRAPSQQLFADGFFLTAREMDWYIHHYVGDRANAATPYASPLLAEDLTGLPPAVVVTAGFDPLRDEGEAYARRLGDAGVAVELRRFAGMIHGFANAVGVSPASRQAMRETAAALVRVLEP